MGRTGDQTSEKLMARDATATAKGAFMAQSHSMSKIRLNDLTSDMKAALRAASVFLTGSERHKVTAFMQAPFTGNYNSQSGEIVRCRDILSEDESPLLLSPLIVVVLSRMSVTYDVTQFT